MAGGISRARLKDSFAPDARALRMLAGIGPLHDDAVLRGVAREVEAEKHQDDRSGAMISHWLARAGLGGVPNRRPRNGAILISHSDCPPARQYDIGQTVAVRDGMVAAVEALEGNRRRAASRGGAGPARTGGGPRPGNRDRTCASTVPRLAPRRWIARRNRASMIGLKAGVAPDSRKRSRHARTRARGKM